MMGTKGRGGSMESIKERLAQELNEVRSELDHLDRRLRERGDYGLGKGDPGIYQWEFNLAMRERYQQRLDDIEHALDRMQQGTFGRCNKCGKAIGQARLEALPFTSTCIACARHAQ